MKSTSVRSLIAAAALARYTEARASHGGPLTVEVLGLSAADERIFLFGINGASVYYLADRLPAHRFLRVNFFVPSTFPDPAFSLEAVVNHLSAQPPRYLIFETLHQSKDELMANAVDSLPEDARLAPLLAGYDLETRLEDFTLYRRRD